MHLHELTQFCVWLNSLKALPYLEIFGEIESEIKYAMEQFLLYCT